ncbi:MAG: hypothetical protein WD334_07465, partial [Chitinophagales bacterium]
SENAAFKNGKPDKKNIYQYLFPNKPYKDLHCRQYLTTLSSMIEKFLETEHLQKEKQLLDHSLLEELIERNSEKLFNQTYQKTNPDTSIKNGQFYLNQFKREDIRNRFLTHFAQRKNRFIAQPDYTQTIQELDTFYLIYKLKYCCELLNYKTIGAVEQETILLDEILELLSKKNYSEIPAINIYYKILLTLTQPENENNFHELMSALKVSDHQFPQPETREMYIYAQNFCIRQINKGKIAYLNELLNIYKILLDRKIILKNEELSPWDYKNIVVTALRSKDFNWANSFINTYKAYLPTKERDNAYSYNLAKYHFYLNNYDSVLDLLQKVEYKDVFYSLDSKAMLMKTYYELRELELLYALMESFKTYLNRKKNLSEHHVKTYKNLIKITKKLTKLTNGDKKKAALIIEQINTTKPLADAGWLKEKAETFLGFDNS